MATDNTAPNSPPDPEAAPPPGQEALVVRSKKLDKDSFPDLDMLRVATLKDGPRARKNAKHTVIRNRHTGQIHHRALVIETLRSRKGEWHRDEKHTIYLTDQDGDER